MVVSLFAERLVLVQIPFTGLFLLNMSSLFFQMATLQLNSLLKEQEVAVLDRYIQSWVSYLIILTYLFMCMY